MKGTALTVAFVALVWAAPANAHLITKPKCDTTKCRLVSQKANLRHVKGVLAATKRVPMLELSESHKQEVRFARSAVRWLAREIRETKAALRPKWAVYSSNSNVNLGARMAARYGWVGSEFRALYDLWNHESGWNHHAQNPSSSACGIPQSMTSCFGYNPVAQIAWGLAYIKRRYGVPSAALANLRAYNWY
jgi:hypothetical protein